MKEAFQELEREIVKYYHPLDNIRVVTHLLEFYSSARFDSKTPPEQLVEFIFEKCCLPTSRDLLLALETLFNILPTKSDIGDIDFGIELWIQIIEG